MSTNPLEEQLFWRPFRKRYTELVERQLMGEAEDSFDSPKQCPVCLVEGKGQHPLRRTQVWSNSPGGTGAPFRSVEVHYTCPHCDKVFWDTE